MSCTRPSWSRSAWGGDPRAGPPLTTAGPGAGARPLPDWCEVTAYYLAAEAFTNAATHANASAVDIVIEEADGTLTVDSPAGAGTVLTVLLPVTADNH